MVITVYLLLLLVTNFSPARSALTGAIEGLLADVMDTEVHIGDLQIGLFNRVILSDVSVKDKSGGDLLKAEKVSAKIELRSLFKHQLALRTVSLLDAEICLNKATATAEPNFQFILDVFKSDDNDKPSSLDLRINSVILRRVAFNYDILDAAQTPTLLNPSHLSFRNINANVSLKGITSDGIKLRIRSFAFEEQSGLCVKNLTLKLEADRTGATIRDFELLLPHSKLAHSKLEAKYDATEGWNSLWPTLQIRGGLSGTTIAFVDLRPLVTLPAKIDETCRLETEFSVTPKQIKLSNLQICTIDDAFNLRADLSLERDSIAFNHIAFQISRLSIQPSLSKRVAVWISEDETLEARLAELGEMKFKGNGEIAKHGEGRGQIELQTDAGSISAQAFWDGKTLNLSSRISQAEPSRVMNNDALPEQVSFNLNSKMTFVEGRLSSSSAELDVDKLLWRGHDYLPIFAQAFWNGRDASFSISSQNPGFDLDLDSEFSLKGKKIEDFSLGGTIRQLSPSLFGLKAPLAQAVFAANVDVVLHRPQSDKPWGSVKISDFSMKGGSYNDYNINHLQLSLIPTGERAELRLRSDFADISVLGPLVFEQLRDGAATLVARALPGLLPTTAEPLDEEWQLDGQVRSTSPLQAFLGLDLTLDSPLNFRGVFHSGEENSSFTLSTQGLSWGAQRFSHISLYFKGSHANYDCLVQAQREIGGNPYKLEVNLSTADSLLYSQVTWKGQTPKKYEGSLSAVTRFMPSAAGGVDFTTNVLPTEVFLADSLWSVASGTLSYVDRDLSIHHLRISHEDHSVAVDGELTRSQNDSIKVSLNQVDVNYILGLVDFDTVDFDGLATGTAVLSNTSNGPFLSSDLNFDEFFFNKGPMGKTNVKLTFDFAEKQIGIDAEMHMPDGVSGTTVDGYVSIPRKGLDLEMGIQGTDLRFLQRYVDGIFGDFRGNATGHMHLYGPFKRLRFFGGVDAEVEARILATGVDYKVSGGHVEMDSTGVFRFKDFDVFDRRGGQGKAFGELRHTYLKDLRYDFTVSADEMLFYDQDEDFEMPFYSTAIGTGTARIQGWPDHFVADLTLSPTEGTYLVYNMGTPDALSTDDRMVKFYAVDDLDDAAVRTRSQDVGSSDAETQGQTEEEESEIDIVLNMLIEANPSAEVKVITDPKAGDNLTVYGNGILRANFHNKGGFQLYGTYTLERGTYKLNIQDVIRKDLSISSGSTITFAGNPLNADLDLNAVYTVNGVTLSDLNYGAGFSEKSVRVDCILNIGGKARSPQVSFDLDLHNISEDEKQMVRQLIATDEDMNRQVIYLLGIGRFYTANSTGSVGEISTGSQSSAAMRSFFSSTLTGQLNSAISNILGSKSHWSFGTNLTTGTTGWEEIEVDGLLQGRLFNDRLLINGNFGYRDRPTYSSNFVGDFDIRYLLTPKGSVSLRAYSETTDRYFTKSSLTTQGIGITLSRDFTGLGELFRRRNAGKGKSTDETIESEQGNLSTSQKIVDEQVISEASQETEAVDETFEPVLPKTSEDVKEEEEEKTIEILVTE